MDSSMPNTIKKLVSESRTSDALALLLEASKPNQQVHAAIQTVLGEFNDLTSQRLRGTIDHTEAAKWLHTIHDKIRMALDAFDSAGKPLPGVVVAGSGPTSQLLSRAGLFLFGGSILLVLLSVVLKIMSFRGASEVMVIGYCLGLGGLFLLVCSLISRSWKPLKG